MLLSIKTLMDYKIEATDGSIGQVRNFLFDDQDWILRYLVADTGSLLPGKKSLIAVTSLQKPDVTLKVFPVNLTRDEVKKSPDIDVEKPVSRQQEVELYQYYNWAPYWTDAYGPIATPYAPVVPAETGQRQQPQGVSVKEQANPHLRSVKEVLGYKIHAEDGEIGHLSDFIVHENEWLIRYLVVDTRNWLPGRQGIIPPSWITDISWSDAEVIVNVTKSEIKNSPKFDPQAPVNREYEAMFYDYYGRPKYWL